MDGRYVQVNNFFWKNVWIRQFWASFLPLCVFIALSFSCSAARLLWLSCCSKQLSCSLQTLVYASRSWLNVHCLDVKILSSKKLFCLKKYRSVKQQFSSWFFLIFLQAPFFRISNKVDYDSPKCLLSCHDSFFYRRNNFIKFQLRPLCSTSDGG